MSQAAASPLGSTPTQPGSGPGAVIIAVSAFFSLLLWLTVAFQVLFIAPRFEKVFMEFKMKLPLMTELVIRDMWWIAPVCLLGVLFICIVQRTRWVGLALSIVLPLAINLLIIASLYSPYLALAEGLGGNAPKL